MAHQRHHFAGDPFADSGFWSPSSSAVNFCEEDYAVTHYIAEFINALSSLSYAYLAIHSNILDPLSSALFAVGITSTVYHATLRQGPQFGDDLSMLFLGACLLQALYTHGQNRARAISVTTAVVIGTLSASMAYIRSGNILHHFVTFTAMVNLLWPRTLYLILFTRRPEGERRALIKQFGKAAALLVGAFVVWNVDLEWCLQLREVRAKMGLPWAWFLELHGWWHVLTAMGAAEYIALIRALGQ